MLKIGIEFPDKNLKNIDLSKPEEGNPGVGGSEYLFAMLGAYLSKSQSNLEIHFFQYGDTILPNSTVVHTVKNEYEMLDKMQDKKIEIFVCQVNKDSDWYDKLSDTNLKAILWAHVYLTYFEQRYMISCDNVKRVVFVGKEEYDAYIDSDLICKSTYIFNMINTKIDSVERIIDKPEVTFIASLVPGKGFHTLAAVWSDVLREVPNAKLNVIGTGQVYDRNMKLGKYGLAQEDYEAQFMQYLLDENGEIIPSVCFWGIMGKEKSELLSRTSVGVVTPNTIKETFCLTAVEMELCGIPVVSRKHAGLLDTVADGKTGFLIKNESELADYIVRLLKDRSLNERMGNAGKEFVKRNFEAEEIVKYWIQLFDDIYAEKPAKYYGVQGNYLDEYKWIKQVFRIIRIKIGIKWFPDFESQKHFLKSLLRR